MDFEYRIVEWPEDGTDTPRHSNQWYVTEFREGRGHFPVAGPFKKRRMAEDALRKLTTRIGFIFDDLTVTCSDCGETEGMTYVQDGSEYYDVQSARWRDGEPTLLASVRRDFECSEQRFLCQCGHTWPVPAQVDVDVL